MCTFAAAQHESIYIDYPQEAGKPQPLLWDQLPNWLSLDMQLRGRTEGQTSLAYKQDNDRIYELTRVFGGADARITPYVTVYAEFIDTHALGLPLPQVQSNMRDAFDLRQGYVDLHSRDRQIPLKLVVGRQELKFGTERVVGISNWSNNSRTWDGFTLKLGDQNNVTLFSTSVVKVHPTSLDTHGAGLTFHGAYASIGPWNPHVHTSPFVLIRTVRGVTGQQGAKGNEVETTFGAEVDGNLPAHFSYVLNGTLQRGSYANNSIHSGAGFGKLAYTADNLPWRPRVLAEYDYATGNAHRNPDRVSTYDQQYPSNHNAFGLVDLFGFQNIKQGRLDLNLAPAKNLTILVQGERLHLAEQRDNLYASNGTTAVAAPAAGFLHNDIGVGFDASATYIFHQYLVADLGVGHLFPGQVLATTGHGAAQTLAYFSLTYRYRAEKHDRGP